MLGRVSSPRTGGRTGFGLNSAVFPQVLLQFIRTQPIGDVTEIHDTEAVAGGQVAAFTKDLHTPVLIEGQSPAGVGNQQQNPWLPNRGPKLILKPADSSRR